MRKILFTKLLVVFLTLFSFCLSAAAQDDAFNNGDRVVNAGIGLGSYISWKGYSSAIPPLAASIEWGVLDLFDGKGGIGVGGYLAFTSFRFKGDNNRTVNDLIIGPRGLFHYQFVEKLDTYAGVMIGYDIVSYSHADSDLSGSGSIFSTFIGARYYLSSNLAIFGELGYGIAPLELGVSFKF